MRLTSATRATMAWSAVFLLAASVARSADKELAWGINLPQALALAFEKSPALHAHRAEVDEARGRVTSARTVPFNPELELEVADRSGSGDSTTDRGVSVRQELEIAGQRGKRTEAAQAELAAAEARFARERRLLAAQVELVFAEAVGARELWRVEQLDTELTRQFREISEKRLAAGAATQLEVNVARAADGRADRQLQLAGASYKETRHFLAELLGLDPAMPPKPIGELPQTMWQPPPLAELLELAVEQRNDLEAIARKREAARTRIRLAKAEARPNLSVGGFYLEEEGDRITGGVVAIALPLFNRNQGGIAESEATAERFGYEALALRLSVERDVASALARYQAAVAAADSLRGSVLGSFEESLGLLRRAFEAGKVGAADLLLIRREIIESQREYIEAATDAWLSRVMLELATGHLSSMPEMPDGE